MNAYDEREKQFGEELMRYLERSILLQVIDNRWREHLFDMDYLREGIHLRGFAQLDPLVAYKNEGFSMFEELMHSIWEEFSKLIFHAEVELDRSAGPKAAFAANGARRPATLDYSGGTLEGQPSALRAGRRGAAPAAGGGDARRARPPRRPATARAEVIETVVKDEHDKIGRNDPCWCGSRQEVQEVPRGLRTATTATRPCARHGLRCGTLDPVPGVHPGLQRARPGCLRRGPRSRRSSCTR